MLTGVPAIKVGMTQVFDSARRVVPVTVVDVSHWYVTQVKVQEKDNYQAVQLGRLRKAYQSNGFSLDLLKNKKTYFEHVREIKIPADSTATYTLGMSISLENVALDEGGLVDVTARSKGKGFQGVVKRWNFAGGPKSHGSGFHRRPGSIGNMATQGEVLKGTKLPGHCGNRIVTVQGLAVVKVDKETGHLFLKGATPGKKESLLIIRKQGQ
jgi:large subunit ribosomal protein L3